MNIKEILTNHKMWLDGGGGCRADLQSANLRNADLRGADLQSANLRDANLQEVTKARLRILPDEGDIIGWKKCCNNILVKLLIKDGTPRSNATGRKCRAAEATVLQIVGADIAVSLHDENFVYKVGSVVKANVWDHNWVNECSGGIHFFITKEEAAQY